MKLRVGSGIKVLCGMGTYCHHGIHLCGGTVLHQTSKGIKLETIQNAGFVVEHHANDGVFEGISKSTKVLWAKDEQISEFEFNDYLKRYLCDNEGYNLLTNNCEHFRNKKSMQVMKASYFGTAAVLAPKLLRTAPKALARGYLLPLGLFCAALSVGIHCHEGWIWGSYISQNEEEYHLQQMQQIIIDSQNKNINEECLKNNLDETINKLWSYCSNVCNQPYIKF